jgi:hypothetical protein
MVALKLQAEAVELDGDLWRLWLESDPEPGLAMRCPIDPALPIAWRELDKLKKLVELEYQGRDPDAASYVTRRKGLETFRWIGHRAARIDLSRSALTELSVDVQAPLVLAIPKTLKTLRLIDSRKLSALTVKTDDGGARLALWIWAPSGAVQPAGLPLVEEIAVGPVDKLDLGKLPWPKLRRLEIFGEDTGIELKNLRKLGSGLEELSITNAFHTDFSTFPSPAKLPSLRSLEIDGVRTEAATLVKERWQGRTKLSIRGVRSDAWLRANADNPFREWAEEYGAAIGARATRAYRTAQSAIDKRGRAEPVLRAFVEAFNAIEDAIDTIMREEIDEAFGVLADRLRVPRAQAIRWFDSWREF